MKTWILALTAGLLVSCGADNKSVTKTITENKDDVPAPYIKARFAGYPDIHCKVEKVEVVAPNSARIYFHECYNSENTATTKRFHTEVNLAEVFGAEAVHAAEIAIANNRRVGVRVEVTRNKTTTSMSYADEWGEEDSPLEISAISLL